jgi:hypothetical protein
MLQRKTFVAWSARIIGHEGREHAHTACRLLPPAAAAPLHLHLFRAKRSCTVKHRVNKSHAFSRLPPSRATETRAKHAALQRCGSRDFDAEYWGVRVCVCVYCCCCAWGAARRRRQRAATKSQQAVLAGHFISATARRIIAQPAAEGADTRAQQPEVFALVARCKGAWPRDAKGRFGGCNNLRQLPIATRPPSG